MDYVMGEASNSPSASEQPVTFREYLPAEPMTYQTIYGGPSLDGYEELMETAAYDLRLGGVTVRSNTEITMDKLEHDFQNILHLQVKGVTVASMLTEPSSTTESSSFSLGFSVEETFTEYHGLSEKQCEDLKSIALRMNSKGRLEKLVSVYVKERKSFMNVHFQKLWDEKLSSNDILLLEWKDMEKKIIRWIQAANCSVRRIFAHEKQLSIQVFKDLGNATDESCFISTVTDSATQLLDFAEAVSSCRQLRERLQMILLLYRRFSDLMPEIKRVFESEQAKSIRVRAVELLDKFAEVVKSTLLGFKDAIHSESSNPIPEGTIHGMTKYVMDATNGIADNGEILMNLITSRPLESPDELQRQTPLATHLLCIIKTLQENLEGKSQKYTDESLSHLFMMNNLRYIAQQIGRSEVLREMVGNDHLSKLLENVEESLTSYLSKTWNRLLKCLRNEGLYVRGFKYRVSKSAVKERFTTFNTLFQEILRSHAIWAVPDLELRNKVHQSILDKLIPSYKDFVEQFGSHIERGSCPGRYIMYPVEELEAEILGLFGDRFLLLF